MLKTVSHPSFQYSILRKTCDFLKKSIKQIVADDKLLTIVIKSKFAPISKSAFIVKYNFHGGFPAEFTSFVRETRRNFICKILLEKN